MKNQNESNEWLTVKEAKEYLRMKSRTTLYQTLYKHNILVNKLSGRVLINRADLLIKMSSNSYRLGIVS